MSELQTNTAQLLFFSVKLSFHVSGGRAKDLQISHVAAAPLFVELNYLRNQSGIVKEKMEAQMALVREQASHLQIKLSVKQKKTITDGLQRKIEMLQTEKTKLQTNKTSLGKRFPLCLQSHYTVYSSLENNNVNCFTFPTAESCGRCQPGWILLKSSCYYFSKGEQSSRKNWHDSRADCVSQGGDLLVINNLEEQVGKNKLTKRFQRVRFFIKIIIYIENEPETNS